MVVQSNFFTPIANMWFELLHWINNGITKDMTAAVTVTVIAFFIFIYIAFRFFVISRLLKDQDQTNITNTLSIILSISFSTLGVYSGVIVSVAGLVTPLIVVIVIGIGLVIWFGMWSAFRTSHAAYAEATAGASEKVGESLARRANAANKLRGDMSNAWKDFKRQSNDVKGAETALKSELTQLEDDDTKILDNLRRLRNMLISAKQMNIKPGTAQQAAGNLHISLNNIGIQTKLADSFYDHAIGDSVKKGQIIKDKIEHQINRHNALLTHVSSTLAALPKGGANRATKEEIAAVAAAKTALTTIRSELNSWVAKRATEHTAIKAKKTSINKTFSSGLGRFKATIANYVSNSKKGTPDQLNRIVDDAIKEVDLLLQLSINEVQLDGQIAQDATAFAGIIARIEQELTALNVSLPARLKMNTSF